MLRRSHRFFTPPQAKICFAEGLYSQKNHHPEQLKSRLPHTMLVPENVCMHSMKAYFLEIGFRTPQDFNDWLATTPRRFGAHWARMSEEANHFSGKEFYSNQACQFEVFFDEETRTVYCREEAGLKLIQRALEHAAGCEKTSARSAFY